MIAVTGATGFIGQILCFALKQQGEGFRVIGRRKSGFGVNYVSWDFCERPRHGMLDNIDTVFHLAGKAHALAETKQDTDEYFRINTEATELLLQACKQQGVKTFVYFSSVKAVGDIEGVMDESVSAEADTPYGQSKWAAEKLVLEGGFVPNPVVIRPSMVYGDTVKGNLSKMILAIQAGKFPPLPEFGNRRSMVHVDDVVRAAMLLAGHAEAAGQIYIVTDGEMYSTRQMYEWICETLHKPVPGWSVPLGVLNVLASAGDMIGALRGSRFMFDSEALDKLTGSAYYSSAKIQHELGFKPQHTLRQSLPEIAHYLCK